MQGSRLGLIWIRDQLLAISGKQNACHRKLMSVSCKQNACHRKLMSVSCEQNACHRKVMSASSDQNACYRKVMSVSCDKNACYRELMANSCDKIHVTGNSWPTHAIKYMPQESDGQLKRSNACHRKATHQIPLHTVYRAHGYTIKLPEGKTQNNNNNALVMLRMHEQEWCLHKEWIPDSSIQSPCKPNQPCPPTSELCWLTRAVSKHVVLEGHVAGGASGVENRGDKPGTVFGNTGARLHKHVVAFKRTKQTVLHQIKTCKRLKMNLFNID